MRYRPSQYNRRPEENPETGNGLRKNSRIPGNIFAFRRIASLNLAAPTTVRGPLDARRQPKVMLLAPQTTEFPHARKIAFVVGVAVALAIAFVLTGMIPTIPAQP